MTTYMKYRALPQETSLLWENVLQTVREMTNKGTSNILAMNVASKSSTLRYKWN